MQNKYTWNYFRARNAKIRTL